MLHKIFAVGLLTASLIACSEDETIITTTPNPATQNCVGNVCTLSGTFTEDLNLTAGNTYVLDGKVTIGEEVSASGAGGNPATMTIAAGVTIYGKATPSAGTTSYLVISRGSKIMAEGTASSPIIFTSEDDYTGNRAEALSQTHTSEWGGIVINGRARINSKNAAIDCATASGADICVGNAEGDGGEYGGNDDNDSSGTLNYVQVRYAGYAFDEDTELNGIGFFGVGSGTSIDYLQVHNGGDDGVEFFGGSVNIKHLIVTGGDDDSIDWTQGWRGKIQYGLVIQTATTANADYGIEGEDGGAVVSGGLPSPHTRPMLSNLTMVDIGSTGNRVGVQLKKRSSAILLNSLVKGWNECFDVKDADTVSTHGVSGAEIIAKSNVWDCPTTNEGDPGQAVESALTGESGSATDSITLTKNYINGTLPSAVTVTDPTAYDSFFENPSHVGAVDSNDDWTTGWTYGLGAAQ